MEPIVLKSASGFEEVAIWQPRELNSETPVLILCHGMWATYRRWKKYGHFFSKLGFLVVAPTYRYHYQGNEFNEKLGKTSIRTYAQDVSWLIRQLYAGSLVFGLKPRNNPLIVIGHSMGGPIAQLVALHVPLTALILIGSAPVAGDRIYTDPNYKKYIRKLFLKILFGKPYLPPFEALSGYVYNRMPKSEHRAIYERAVHESGTAAREILAGSGEGLVKWLCRLSSKPIEIDENLIHCPVLVINGRQDKVVPLETAADLALKYSRRDSNVLTELRIFDDFAHWPMCEPPQGNLAGWEKSADFILNWLKTNT